MPSYKEAYQVEITHIGEEDDYSFDFQESLNTNAPNKKEALNPAINQINKISPPNKTTILENLISQ